MHRITITFALACTLQACTDLSQQAIAASLGTVLNEQFPPVTSAPVDRQHHGEDWPFIVDSGIIGCEDRLYTYYKANGHTYKLTEMTKPNYESVAPIWRDNPNKAGRKYSLLVVIDAAMGFCDLA
jgi:hypothetical protein